MSYSKREFVMAAFEEIGIAGYTFDLQPQQLEFALRRLDLLMAGWNARGIRLAYPLPSNPSDSDLDEITRVPDSANEAVVTNLALRIASAFGKTPADGTRMMAKQGYDLLLSRAAQPIEMQLPSDLPAGAGTKPWRRDNPFVLPPVDPLQVGSDALLDF